MIYIDVYRIIVIYIDVYYITVFAIDDNNRIIMICDVDFILLLGISRFGDFLHLTYQNGLEVKDTTEIPMSAFYIDPDLEIDNGGRLQTNLYDFTFPIVNLPFSRSSSASTTYVIHISQPICYHRACDLHRYFLAADALKLLKQGHFVSRLMSSLHKFYGHHDLVDCYEIPISQMIMYLFLFT